MQVLGVVLVATGAVMIVAALAGRRT